MKKFNKGDKVKIGLNASSPYRGHTGIVQTEIVKASSRIVYCVKLDLKDFTLFYQFREKDIELVRKNKHVLV